MTFAELAQRMNPVVTAWMQYYGRVYRSELYPLLARINAYLVQWIRRACPEINKNVWQTAPH
ncbi:group II intron maturase-specific domain-containing protein [Streptomyces sp. NPDC002159]